MEKNYIPGQIYVEAVMTPGKLVPDGWCVFTFTDGRILKQNAIHAPLCKSEAEAETVKRVWQQIRAGKSNPQWLWELRSGHEVMQNALNNPVA